MAAAGGLVVPLHHHEPVILFVSLSLKFSDFSFKESNFFRSDLFMDQVENHCGVEQHDKISYFKRSLPKYRLVIDC